VRLEIIATTNCSTIIKSSVCILIYVSMYLYSYPSTHGISGLAAGSAWEQFEVRLKMMIQWTERYILRPRLSDIGDALGRGDWAYMEIHLEAVIERVWRCARAGHDRANLQALIERVCRYTCRLWLSEFGDGVGGCDRASLEIQLEAVIEGNWTSMWRWSMDGAPGLNSSGS